MSSSDVKSSEIHLPSGSDREESLRKMWIFIQWCLRREALSLWNYLLLIVPWLVAGYFTATLISQHFPQQGTQLLKTLFWIAALFILVGGVRHASKAVCWEVSRELRELVRLTEIEPKTLLWCKSICRWWTVGLSILLILPLAMFARTMGAVNLDLWFAGGSWLVLLMVLTAGFAMIASVSSNVSNPETTAATATFLLMVLYHVLFWGFCAVIGLTSWMMYGTFDLPTGSPGRQAMLFFLSLTPIAGLYRTLATPSVFTPLDPTYWLHFITAGFCLWAASIVMQNRFRVTTRGDADSTESAPPSPTAFSTPFSRPRCGTRPFFWKDTYILGGGLWVQSWWTIISIFALVGVFVSAAYDFPLVAGVVAVCAAPCLIAVRFDNLLVPEFREQTWNSLMLLPIDPRLVLVEKVFAAVWERKAILLPVGVAAGFGLYSNATAVLMAGSIALLAGILMIQISILNQFYSKSWWVGPAVALLTLSLIEVLVLVWVIFPAGPSYATTMITMGSIIVGLLWHIEERLRHWSEE